MNDAITFKVSDAQGVQHDYRLTYHPPTGDGIAISVDIAGLGIEPIAELMSSMILELDIEELGGVLDLDPADVLSKIDFSKIGERLRPALMSGKVPGLPARILSQCDRDGKPLSSEFNFNEAYRGNYGEMWKAVWRAVQENGFLPLPNISLESVQNRMIQRPTGS